MGGEKIEEKSGGERSERKRKRRNRLKKCNYLVKRVGGGERERERITSLIRLSTLFLTLLNSFSYIFFTGLSLTIKKK